MSIIGIKAKGIQSKTMDKGQKQELEIFAQAIKQGGKWRLLLK